MRGLTTLPDPRLLIGSATSDDAAVFQISDDFALVQTLDFFTPIVDDPYLFGQIAAANSLSDVYAMGGRPLTAMNIVGFPEDLLPLDVLETILKGGADKIAEAGAVLAGGHTVKNPELFYGLSVTGQVHPKRLISNAGGRPGDRLILTKPLGTGIISTALKRQKAPPNLVAKAAELMATLNLPGTILAEEALCRGGTDITGFGLLGHLTSLAKSSDVTVQLHASKLPVIDPLVLELIEEGCVPGGTRANLEHALATTLIDPEVSKTHQLLAADAQTSGGLLLAIPPQNWGQACELLEPLTSFTEVGRLTSSSTHLVELRHDASSEVKT